MSQRNYPKKAFLILGPEGSGTKLLTRLFVDAGCFGDWTHKQRNDLEIPSRELIVIRRSFPHGKRWPNLQGLVKWLSAYEVRAVVIIRTFRCTLESRKRRRKDNEKALNLALRSLPDLMIELKRINLPYRWITYEALIQRPELEINWLFDWAGIDPPKVDYIFDANERYNGIVKESKK